MKPWQVYTCITEIQSLSEALAVERGTQWSGLRERISFWFLSMIFMNQYPRKKSDQNFFYLFIFLTFLSSLGNIPREKDGTAWGRKYWFGCMDWYIYVCKMIARLREEILLSTSVIPRNSCCGAAHVFLCQYNYIYFSQNGAGTITPLCRYSLCYSGLRLQVLLQGRLIYFLWYKTAPEGGL